MPQVIKVSLSARIKFWTGDDLGNENVPSNAEETFVIDVDVEELILTACAN